MVGWLTDWLIDWLIDWLLGGVESGPAGGEDEETAGAWTQASTVCSHQGAGQRGHLPGGGGVEGLSWKKKLDVGPHYLEKHYKYNIKVLLHFQICTWQSRRHWSVGGFRFLKVCFVVQKKFWNYLLSKSVTNLEIKKNILKRKD